MMTRLCMASTRPDEAAEAAPAVAGGARRRDSSGQDRLRGQPGVEEAPLAFGGGLAGHRADGAPAAPLQAPAAQRVGLEGEEQVHGEAGEPRPARIDRGAAGSSLQGGTDEHIADKGPPQAVGEEPKRRKQQGKPGKAVLDEDEALGPVDAVGRRIRRLVHGISEHGVAPSRGSCPWSCRPAYAPARRRCARGGGERAISGRQPWALGARRAALAVPTAIGGSTRRSPGAPAAAAGGSTAPFSRPGGPFLDNKEWRNLNAPTLA